MKKVKLRNKKKFINQRKSKTSHKWVKREIPIKNGGYNIGPEGRYFLSETALSHIVHGDFTERLIENHGQRTGEKETILKGGLHTYKAWIEFKNLRNDVVHLKFFNSKKHHLWYYARNLQNGVITLKIPKELFQSQAANITKFPDMYYKSGYLWKTLFPKEKTELDIINIIDEALYNLNREESQNKLLIGYALLTHPLTALKIRIQCIGNNINSAFPTWEQPMTGNNGKAYSHSDTISFTMAASTEYFDDETKNFEHLESNIYVHETGIESLILNTPSFLLNRPKLPVNEEVKNWKSSRESELLEVSRKINESEILAIQNYLEDSFVCKDGYFFQQDAYDKIFSEFEKNTQIFNAISINQNIIEAITVIYNYDQIHKSSCFLQTMKHILLNKIIYTGALDSWHNKILHNKILDFVLSYHDENIISLYINIIGMSPIKNSLYTEFDLANICIKREFDLMDDHERMLFSAINLPIDKYKIKPVYFRDYLQLHLSENYFMNFNENIRNKFIDQIISELGKNFEKFVEHSIFISSTNDFIFFQEKFNHLVEKIIRKNISGIEHNSLSTIIKDYFRIQTAQRMKITLRKPDLKLDAMEYFDYDSEEYKLHTLIKHGRRLNVFSLEAFLDDSLKLATYLNDEKLISIIKKYKGSVWTERPPIQKFIPSYIKHWINHGSLILQNITKPSTEQINCR